MELLKKNIRMNRQKSRAVNQVTLEEDVNVPDSRPDVGTLIQEEGNLKMEETKILEGQILLGGMLEVKLLYVSDDGERQIHRLDVKLPFEEKLNLEGAQAGDNIRVKWEMEDLSIHLINSRKLSIRALVTFAASIEELYDTQAAVELHGVAEVTGRTKELMPLSLAVQKKDILRIRDEITLASNKPNIGELLWESVQLRGPDVRVAEGQINIRGELFIFVLYAGDDENGTKQWVETAMPFAGSIECGECAPSMIPDVEITLSSSSLEVRPDYDGEERLIQVEAVLDLDIKLYEEERVEILADVYTPIKELVPVISREIYESLVMKNYSKCRANERMRMEAGQPRMLQICHSKGDVRIDDARITERGVQVEGAVHVSILYITADDALPFARMRGMVPFQHLIEVEEIRPDCRFSLKTELEQLSTMMIDSEELEVKASVNLGVLIVQVHQEACITDVEERELDLKKIQELPGIVGYIVQPGDSLWKIAKTYYTTPKRVADLNGLENEEVQAGQRLLIVKEAGRIS